MEPELHPALVEDPSPHKPGDRFWIPVLAAVLVVGLGIWLWLTPPGFWGKLQAFGYSICHQISERSFHAHDTQAPLCARCTGMYLGAVLSIVFQFGRGRRGLFPPLWVNLVLGALFVWFGLDGINSTLHLIPGFTGPYEPSELLRLITGMGAGLGIGAVLVPTFNQTVWKNWQNQRNLSPWVEFVALLGVAALAIWATYSQLPVFLYPAMIISGLGIPFVLTLVYTLLAVVALRRENLFTRWRELVLPFLIGMLATLAQISAISFLRYLLTGSWGPLNP